MRTTHFFCPRTQADRIKPGIPGADLNQLEGPDSEIAARLNTAYRKVLVVGKQVFVPPIFSHRSRPYVFNIRQLRLLHYLQETNGDIEKASEQAEVSLAWARRFLKSSEYRQFANEAIEDQATHDGWTPRRVVLEIDQIYKGSKRVTEEQLDALKMMKDIVVPKQRGDASLGGAGVTVNLNFPTLPADVQSKLKDIAEGAAVIDVDAA